MIEFEELIGMRELFRRDIFLNSIEINLSPVRSLIACSVAVTRD